jgi:hypothetical protein
MREMPLPTLPGLTVLLSAALAAGWFARARIQPFLAVNRPIGGDVLVMEGWIPEYAMRQALDAFRSQGYRRMLITGGAMPQGMAFSSSGTYAHYGAEALRGFGLPSDSITELPSPEVGRDRTFQEGLCVRDWLAAEGRGHASLDLFSFSTHARRSLLLYRLALGENIAVGVYAPRDREYDPSRWWKSSNGVRRVTDEAIAYAYAKFWFRVPR